MNTDTFEKKTDKLLETMTQYGVVAMDNPVAALGTQVALQTPMMVLSITERKKAGVSLMHPFYINKKILAGIVITTGLEVVRQRWFVKKYGRPMHKFGISSIEIAEIPSFKMEL